jgi:hypothetical protein
MRLIGLRLVALRMQRKQRWFQRVSGYKLHSSVAHNCRAPAEGQVQSTSMLMVLQQASGREMKFQSVQSNHTTKVILFKDIHRCHIVLDTRENRGYVM